MTHTNCSDYIQQLDKQFILQNNSINKAQASVPHGLFRGTLLPLDNLFKMVHSIAKHFGKPCILYLLGD